MTDSATSILWSRSSKKLLDFGARCNGFSQQINEDNNSVIPGAPQSARWIRSKPRRNPGLPVLERMVGSAFPHGRLLGAEPLLDGLRNANFKLRLDCAPETIVLRIYEHDASICQKELDLIHLVAPSIPMPEVIHAEPRGLENLPPFLLMRYVDGISFRDLKRSGDRQAIAQAAYSAGEVLAAIGCITFSKPGWLAPGPTVTEPLLEGEDSVPRFIDLCLASENLQQRMPLALRSRIHAFVWSYAPRLQLLNDETRLVHGDFGKRNLLVGQRDGCWSVIAVLDWEFAVSGSPLADIGHFLRYEPASNFLIEPHFSSGYLKTGGTLPEDWRDVTRIIDLAALCESLTHDQLPDPVVTELLELIRGTVENRERR
jgi:fructokinase